MIIGTKPVSSPLKATPVSASPSASSASDLGSSEQSGAEQIAVLMDQVRTKDTLVLQLTERLEAAAEQLDRLQRSGADRRHPSSGGGGSRELAEQTGQLTSRVEEALENWGQTSGHYEVILQRLDEIADHLTQAGGSSTQSAAHSRAPVAAPAKPTSMAPSAPGAAGPGQGSFWEKMKASMIEGGPAPAPSAPPAQIAAVNSSSPTQTEEEEEETVLEPVSLDHIAPPPEVIDVDTASIEALREAVATRDAYISTLISELRSVHTLPPLPADLMNSGMGPDELLSSLMEMEKRLKVEVQRECLELSLERARMGRERARLDQVKAQLEEQIKRLAAPAPTEKPEENKAGAAPDKFSWLKRLTPKKPNE